MIDENEHYSLVKQYNKLTERADAWIMESRRLTMSQVTLYLGAWVVVVGSALLLALNFTNLTGTPLVLTATAGMLPALWIGIYLWNRTEYGLSIGYLMAFCLLLPLNLTLAMMEWNWFTGFTQGKESLEIWHRNGEGPTNAQLWWAIALCMPAHFGLRRYTRAPVFTLLLSAFGTLLCLVTIARLGFLDWFEDDPGRLYFDLLPCALIFFLLGGILEWRRQESDSRFFYPMFVVFVYVAFSGLAYSHGPWAQWLKLHVPDTRGQVAYLFLLNAVLYFVLQSVFERFGTRQLGNVAKAFRFALPGHILGSILALGITARDAGYINEARSWEILLPLISVAFVYFSVAKQMKNFFITGVLFLAMGLYRVQDKLLHDRALWPVSLLIVGTLLMAAAANYARLRLWLRYLWRATLRHG